MSEPLPHGLNLADYFPTRRTFNSIVYYHKKFLKPTRRPDPTDNGTSELNPGDKLDKLQTPEGAVDNNAGKTNANLNDSVLEQTIKFAKNIVPLVMPDKDNSLFYTIKTGKKIRRPKTKEHKVDIGNTQKTKAQTFRKDHPKEVFRRNIENHSSDRSSIERINLSHSMSCSVSEVSERKISLRETKRKPHVAPTESFEALATEMLKNYGDTKIKIHLMSDIEKTALREDIQKPVIEAIKKCIEEYKKCDDKEIRVVQKVVASNAQKIDKILHKIDVLESNLDKINIAAVQSKIDTPRSSKKPSMLEELSQDLLELKEEYSEETSSSHDTFVKVKNQGASAKLSEGTCDKKVYARKKDGGHGEDTSLSLEAKSSTTQLGSKLERPNRQAARFCWTDAVRKSVSET